MSMPEDPLCLGRTSKYALRFCRWARWTRWHCCWHTPPPCLNGRPDGAWSRA